MENTGGESRWRIPMGNFYCSCKLTRGLPVSRSWLPGPHPDAGFPIGRGDEPDSCALLSSSVPNTVLCLLPSSSSRHAELCESPFLHAWLKSPLIAYSHCSIVTVVACSPPPRHQGDHTPAAVNTPVAADCSRAPQRHQSLWRQRRQRNTKEMTCHRWFRQGLHHLFSAVRRGGRGRRPRFFSPNNRAPSPPTAAARAGPALRRNQRDGI